MKKWIWVIQREDHGPRATSKVPMKERTCCSYGKCCHRTISSYQLLQAFSAAESDMPFLAKGMPFLGQHIQWPTVGSINIQHFPLNGEKLWLAKYGQGFSMWLAKLLLGPHGSPHPLLPAQPGFLYLFSMVVHRQMSYPESHSRKDMVSSVEGAVSSLQWQLLPGLCHGQRVTKQKPPPLGGSLHPTAQQVGL